MARNETQYYDPSQDQEELVRLELDGEMYEMPASVAAQASKDFGAGQTPSGQARMTADEFAIDEPPAPAPKKPARAKPRAAAPVDMDLTNDPEALAAGNAPPERDWVDERADGPNPPPPQKFDMDLTADADALAGEPDPVGRSMMHDAFDAAVPRGVERLPSTPGLAEAWGAAQGRPMPTPPPGGMPGPSAPSGDPVGRASMHQALGNASIPSRPRTVSDPIAGGFPEAWSSATNTPLPSPTTLADDPEAIDALAGPSPTPPPAAGPQYDMIVDPPSQDELEGIRKRLSGFRVTQP